MRRAPVIFKPSLTVYRRQPNDVEGLLTEQRLQQQLAKKRHEKDIVRIDAAEQEAEDDDWKYKKLV